MLKTGPADPLASSRAYYADADAGRGNAIPDPERDVTPSGTPHCKNAGSNVPAGSKNARSIPAVRSAAPENLRSVMLGAGPRATAPSQLTPLAVRVGVADTADFGPAAAPDPGRSPDTAGSPADAANAELLADNLRCNSVLADAVPRTAARIP